MRFVAAFYVVLYHYCFSSLNINDNSPFEYPVLSNLFQYGYFGVDIFFVISGFVIAASTKGGDSKRFLKTRFLRLYPAYWVCVTISFFIIITFSQSEVSLYRYFINLTMLQSFALVPHIDAVYWTLSYELIFYFWVFIIIVFLREEALEYWAYTFILLAFACLFFEEHRLFRIFFLTEWSPYFAAGVLFFKVKTKGQSILRWSFILFSIFISIIRSMDVAESMSTYHGVAFNSSVIIYHLIAVNLYFFYVARVDQEPSWLSSKLIIMMGLITYPLYLLHGSIGNILLGMFKVNDKYVGLAIVVLTMILLSYIVTAYLEPLVSKPLRRWIGKYT